MVSINDPGGHCALFSLAMVRVCKLTGDVKRGESLSRVALAVTGSCS